METINFFEEYNRAFVILHVLAVLVGMGSALISDLVFTFFAQDKVLSSKELQTLSRLSKTVWVSLAIIIASGFFVFLSNPAFYLASDKFLAKMTTVLILILNGYILYRFVQPHLSQNFMTDRSKNNVRKLAFICGAISIVSWFSALILATLHSIGSRYWAIITVYGVAVILGSIVSLTIENIKFRSK